MKTVPLALLFIIALASCSKDGVVYMVPFQKSFQAWLAFKDSSNNSYRYMVTTGSWTGYSTETLITVRNGQVTERSFTARMLRRTATSFTDSVVTQWTEDATRLSTHEYAAAPVTLDEIYKEARENWLRKRDDADTYFEANNNGKLSSCGYVPHNCADDCFNGISIQFIEAL
jgi:hypothetical protein